MSYLLICSITAFATVFITKTNARVWCVLGFVYLTLWLCNMVFDPYEMGLYILRAFLAFFTAKILLSIKSKMGLYQAFMQLLMLVAYGMLEYETGLGEHVIIYNNFEAVIYGLATGQFLAIFSELWACCRK